MCSFRLAIVSAAVVRIVASCGSADAAYLWDLGDLPGGFPFSYAEAVSADGKVAVGWSATYTTITFSEIDDAFRWTHPGPMYELPSVSGHTYQGLSEHFAYDTSADGNVVVGAVIDRAFDNDEAFRWSAVGGSVAMGDLPGGTLNSTAFGVSDDGSVVVGYGTSSQGIEAFRSTGTTIQATDGLGDLPGGVFESRAFGVSADGLVVVGGSSSDNGPEAFRWTAETGMVPLGDLPSGTFASGAAATSADGSVVVGYGTSKLPGGWLTNFEAFRWTEATGMVGLGNLPGGPAEPFRSGAQSVTADGTIIVGYGTYGTVTDPYAMIWDATHGMRELQQVLVSEYGLNLTGWTLKEAKDISADGTVIVGTGISPSSIGRAWMAILTPPGDYNFDRIVDAADYVMWRKTLSQTGSYLLADGNGNGVVDAGDYDVWRAHFGQTAGSSSGTGSFTFESTPAVPEPASFELGCCCALVLLTSLRARRYITSAFWSGGYAEPYCSYGDGC